MDNVLESYLVKLGATQDTASFVKFNTTLKDATTSVDRFAEFSVKSFAKLDVAIVTAFASFGTSIITLADKTAMADRQFNLMGTRMLMTKNSFRAMQGALDTLGVSLSDIVTDGTGELNKEFQDLYERNVKLGNSLGTTFDPDMVGIRKLIIEVKQFGTELGFLAMGSVAKLYEKLGLGTGDVLTDLRKLNHTFSDDIPMWADKVSTYLLPVWGDMRTVLTGVGKDAEAVALGFTNVVSQLSGDSSIESTTFKFENFATALVHTANGMAAVVEGTDKVLHTIYHGLSASGSEIVTGISNVTSSYFSGRAALLDKQGKHKEADEMRKKSSQWSQWANQSQEEANSESGKAYLPWMVDSEESNYGTAYSSTSKPKTGSSIDKMRSLAIRASEITGLPAKLIYAQWAEETGGFSSSVFNKDNNAAGINVPGGNGTDYKKYNTLDDFVKDYSNQITSSRYTSKGIMDAGDSDSFAHSLKQGGYYTGSEADYATGMKRYEPLFDEPSGKGTGSVNINQLTVNVPNGTPIDKMKDIISDSMVEYLRKQNRTVMAQTASGAFK
jgi:flagellum-specific peptidoglycan hydrolase FlgJ